MITENGSQSSGAIKGKPPVRRDDSRSGGNIQPMPNPYGKGGTR